MTTEHEKLMIENMIKDTGIKAGDVFVDVGANIGQELEYLAPLGVTIYSYEPHPIFCNIIVTKYGMLPNVHITEAGLSDHNGSEGLHCKKTATAINGGPSIKNKSNCMEIPSYTIRVLEASEEIAKIIKAHGKIKVLKIDTEGSEYDILSNLMLKEIDLSKIEYLYVEDHFGEINDYQFELLRDKVLTYWSGPKIQPW